MSNLKKPTTISTSSRGLSLAVTWLVVVIALASFAVSFQGLNAVATWAGLSAPISWLVCVAVDAGLAVFAAAVLVRRGQGRSAALVWMLTAWLVVTSVAANAAHVLAPVARADWTPQLWAGAAISASMPLILFASIEVLSMVAISKTGTAEALAETPVEEAVLEAPVAQPETSTVEAPAVPAPVPARTIVDAAPLLVPAVVPAPAPAAVVEASAPRPAVLPAFNTEPAATPVVVVAPKPAAVAPAPARSVAQAPARKPSRPAPSKASAVRAWTDDDLAEAIRMTKDGLSRQKVADALGVSKSAVTRALAAHEAKAAA